MIARESFLTLTFLGLQIIARLTSCLSNLKTTVPLGSYIKKFFIFFYYASLSTCCKYFEKKLEAPEKLGKSKGLSSKGSS